MNRKHDQWTNTGLQSMLSAMFMTCCAWSNMAGKPNIKLDRDSVAYLLAMNFKASDIANILEVSPKTLSQRLQE